jgi:ABC-2 type transport system permease protein
MSLAWSRVLDIARREYLAIVRRKAFLFTVLGTPAYFAFVMWMAMRPQVSERIEAVKKVRVLGVVDSSGVFPNAAGEVRTDVALSGNFLAASTARPQVRSFNTEVRLFPDQKTAEDSLRSGGLSQLLVIPADYLETGKLRRYARSSNVFSSTAGDRPVTNWLVRGLLSGAVDSVRIARVTRPLQQMDDFTLGKQGQFELKDERREMFDFLMPFTFGMLLGLCIVIGGQYLLQGVSEEKESRILESLLCTVSSEELLAGKLVGLGAAGLTLVALWMAMSVAFAAPAAALAKIHLPPLLLVVMLAYLLLGYLFYGSLMTGIGAITNNMREAQQFAFMFTFANWVPFIMITSIVAHPEGRLAVGLSLFPPTAPVTMMMRMAVPGATVPAWQTALSMALLAGTAWLALVFSARIFRIGLLMYGKTPNLPEIIRWAGRK